MSRPHAFPPRVQRAYLDAIDALSAAPAAGDRRAIVLALAGDLGVTERTAYANLRAFGYDSGRAKRRDAGTSRISREDCGKVAALFAKARNKRGQANLPQKEAMAIAKEIGLLDDNVSYRQLNRRLRREGLSLEHMNAAEASVPRVSSHPNHTWFFDISPCTHWYFKDPANGKRLAMYADGGARFYDGKPQNLPDASTKRIMRFVVVDHYSGAWFVRYYYAAGEKAEDVIDFLFRAMADKGEIAGQLPFRGVPKRIVMDQGSANKSALVCNLLESLNIRHELHRAGNAKASGSVESKHFQWQRPFEGRLALCPLPDLDAMNREAAKLCAIMAGERPHTRHGQPPMVMWNGSITSEQLVDAPSREVFFALAETHPAQRTLSNELYMRAAGRTWQIAGENVYPGQKVNFRLTPFCEAGVRVTDEHDTRLTAVEITFNKAGFPENGLRHEWDNPEAAGAAQRPSAGQALSAKVTSGETPVNVPELFNNYNERFERLAYLQRSSSPSPVSPSPAQVERWSDLECREKVVQRTGQSLRREDAAWWRARCGAAGLTPAEFEEALVAFTTPASTKEAVC